MDARIEVTGAGGAASVAPPLPGPLPDLTFRRILHAPIALVFKAWTDPLHVSAWWGPHGFSNPFTAIEPWEGGRFHVHMQGPDGAIQPMGGHVVEIEAPSRIVFVTSLPDEDGEILVETVHAVTLVDRGDRTEMTLRSTVAHAAPLMQSQFGAMEDATRQSLERLGSILRAI